MKNFCIIFLTLIIISVTALGFSGKLSSENPAPNAADYLRIHIRADSNDESAQAVKYRVRDSVVSYLTPLVAQYNSKREALTGLKSRLGEVEQVANATLRENGFFYGATASLTTESFPTRLYGEYLLPAGEYSALLINLGSGRGDNWWCVVYPPLCFTGTQGNVIYKSKIKEIIDKFYK